MVGGEPREVSGSMARRPDAGLVDVCRGVDLEVAFQPIFRTVGGGIYGYEALMRPPPPWRDPLELIGAAQSAGLGVLLELSACESAIRAFTALRLDGRLFLNMGAAAVKASGVSDNHIVRCALAHGLAPARVVIELTEREPVLDLDGVIETMRALRSCGLGIALDDYGQGYSGMRLWLDLRPEFIKIDQYFIADLQTSSPKFEALRSIVRMARGLDTALIAEGIETHAELAIVRDLGVELAQGFLLGRPQRDPVRSLDPQAMASLAAGRIAVFPEKLQVHAPHQTVGQLLKPIPSVERDATNADVARLFDDSGVHALAVLHDGRPIGMINRQAFLDRLHKPFHLEVYGRRPCTTFMNADPLIVEAEAPIESLMQVLAGDDQRYLSDGFVIVDNGRYLGLGTGEALVRAVSALRIEAARHANPLTFLPGNIPITSHIERLLAGGVRFVAAYTDLDNFKPYNDQYGYWRGDEMIKLAASVLLSHVDPMADFVGHVGGDDFVVLFQSPDWERRCESIIAAFREAARTLYNDADRARGGVDAEDRRGSKAFFALTTMSIGVAEIEPGYCGNAENVASRAAVAKRLAKAHGNCVARMPPESGSPPSGARERTAAADGMAAAVAAS